MIFLNTFSERAHAQAMRARRSHGFTADQRTAIGLVLDHVHPGNLGALPPCPATLLYKARQIGLL
ncbi:hypothetical protein N5E86_15985 [Stutzerimonas stutzeri]|uniref:hypothetical protein n=1 Tax=Stutzerimonas stutzeri TaxID=316 RepID=UPI0024491DC3|nr:hypothetical protein [Stutzerimonas stutzeri]MDH1555954.1 hypothetical protein [Stutzerimonas stutzeri]